MTTPALERYRPLLGAEWPDFAQRMSEPLPQCVAVNPLRLDRAALRSILERDGQTALPATWQEQALLMSPEARPGLHFGYRAGLFGIQEEASLLPVRLLDVHPGQRVLDLCAAPGGKSARLALALANRGTLVANDASQDRLAAVADAVRRLGLLNVTITCHDGGSYPARDAQFDAVLVDAPCSSEGTLRKVAGSARLRTPKSDFRHWVSGVQRALLRRAVQLTRAGGRIVYSTCTFAPEENEAVVSDLLAESGDGLRVSERPVPGLASERGLQQWDGQRFDSSLQHAHRLWPHRTGTGGFFAVALERLDGGHHVEAQRAPGPSLELDNGLWRRRFGLPDDCFDDLRFHRAGRFIRAVASDHAPPRRVQMLVSGIAFERHGVSRRKLSTTAATLYGDRATRNLVEVDATRLAAYRARRAVPVAESLLGCCDGPGHVLVRHLGHVVGVAQLARTGETAMLASLYPKDWYQAEQDTRPVEA